MKMMNMMNIQNMNDLMRIMKIKSMMQTMKIKERVESDVNDDVRRAAVEALGFILFRTPEQCPSIVSLLSESYNPHVRYGAAMALGIACAGTGNKEASAVLEPMLNDAVNYVRQGVLVANVRRLLCLSAESVNGGYPGNRSS